MFNQLLAVTVTSPNWPGQDQDVTFIARTGWIFMVIGGFVFLVAFGLLILRLANWWSENHPGPHRLVKDGEL